MSPAPPAPLLIHRVIARLNVGGPAMHVVNLARAMDGDAWRTRLVAGSVADDEGDMAYYAEERGVEVTWLPGLSRAIRPLADLGVLWALWRLFRRERPTVVHTHTAKAGTLGRLAALLAGVPVRIHTFHGHVLGGGYFSAARTRFFLEVERQLARGTSRLVVLTERQATEMAEELGVAPRERFAVVPLGLELEAFRDADRARLGAGARRELGLDDDEVAVGIVGRLVPIKNHELFLEALAALRKGGPGRPRAAPPPSTGAVASGGAADPPVHRGRPRIRGVVVGSGEREAALRRRAEELGLGDDVLWLGWRRDLPRLYAALDAVALTSHDEGTPVALLEALAAGTPVVAREVGGVGEVLRRAGAGRLVPPGAGPEVWARALAEETGLPGHGGPSGRSRVPGEGPPDPGSAPPRWAGGLARSVREEVARRYSVERLVDDLARLYREEAERA